MQGRLTDAQLALPSISLGQQIDNLQIQIETKVSLLWVEPNYGFMSSHLYSDLREISLSITHQPHVNSLRITWVEKLKNAAPYRTLRYMTSLHDIVVCYLCSLIWAMSMKALAKTQRQHDNLHREMDSHVQVSNSLPSLRVVSLTAPPKQIRKAWYGTA